MTQEYAPLHVHSDASSDGAGTVSSLVSRAKAIGCRHLGLTDHGTLANAVAFWSACTEVEIKPILGIEAYLLYNGQRHHLTLLSLSETGFNNLIHLDSWSHSENYISGYPLLTLDELHNHRDGIYALTGCASSAIFRSDDSEGAGYLGDLLDTMGRSQVGLETMFIGSHDTWTRPIRLHNHTKLPLVITNDTHYPCREQHPAHQVITKSRKGFTYDSQHLWLKTADEIERQGSPYARTDLIREGLHNTLLIADAVEPWNMAAKPSLPHIDDCESSLVAALKSALKRNLPGRSDSDRETRKDRLQYEFRILSSMGFLDYIYILWDIVSWARGRNIYVGPGRGSGGGSYVLYLLGVTSIDPIEHGLVFERFLNPSRSDYPDVDVDFESDRRDEVLSYAGERWGTVPIATYSCYSHKSAVHDIARVLTIPKDLEKQAAEAGMDSEIFTEFIGEHPDTLVTYNTMIGQIRHKGKHAAGVIIANRPVPIERAPNGQLVAAWAEGSNTKDLSKVGIVKYDLLGLTALSQLKKMHQLADAPGLEYLGKWTYDDPKVYDLFCKGDVAGIFQWSGSEGIRDLTVRIAPRNFYDLTTCNALYRPGALDAGTAEHYPEFMKEPRKIHPRIDRHLEKTYGVICYQEQVMAVVAEVMGGDLAQADIVRRLMSKAAVGDPKWESEIFNLQAKFMVKGEGNGFTRELLAQLWHEVYTHSRYSYNLAHASAYTMISYQMAWYKVYHRPSFTVSVLQYDRANAQTYILDAVENGLKIKMPHVNHSGDNYMLIDDTIYLPLTDISFLGEKAAVQIIHECFLGGAFDSYEDFAKRIPKRTCNNRTRAMLERIGAFSGLSGNPASAIDKYDDLEMKGTYQTQLEILGYVIPTPSLYSKIKKLMAAPAKKNFTRFAGFISEVKNKESSHGKYSVFTLSPEGSFWMRTPRATLKVGTFVSGTKSKFGHSNDVRSFRLDSGE